MNNFIEVYETVERLNNLLYKNQIEDFGPFSFEGNEICQIIKYGDQTIWFSEDDTRLYLEDINQMEPLFDTILRNMKTHLKDVKKHFNIYNLLDLVSKIDLLLNLTSKFVYTKYYTHLNSYCWYIENEYTNYKSDSIILCPIGDGFEKAIDLALKYISKSKIDFYGFSDLKTVEFDLNLLQDEEYISKEIKFTGNIEDNKLLVTYGKSFENMEIKHIKLNDKKLDLSFEVLEKFYVILYQNYIKYN